MGSDFLKIGATEKGEKLFSLIKKIVRTYMELREEMAHENRKAASETGKLRGMQDFFGGGATVSTNGRLDDIEKVLMPRLMLQLKCQLEHFTGLQSKMEAVKLTHEILAKCPSKSNVNLTSQIRDMMDAEQSLRQHLATQEQFHHEALCLQLQCACVPPAAKLTTILAGPHPVVPPPAVTVPRIPDALYKRIQTSLNLRKLTNHINSATPTWINTVSRKRAREEVGGIQNRELRNLMFDMNMKTYEANARTHSELSKGTQFEEERAFLQETVRMCQVYITESLEAVPAPMLDVVHSDVSGPIEDMQFTLIKSTFKGMECAFNRSIVIGGSGVIHTPIDTVWDAGAFCHVSPCIIGEPDSCSQDVPEITDEMYANTVSIFDSVPVETQKGIRLYEYQQLVGAPPPNNLVDVVMKSSQLLKAVWMRKLHYVLCGFLETFGLGMAIPRKYTLMFTNNPILVYLWHFSAVAEAMALVHKLTTCALASMIAKYNALENTTIFTNGVFPMAWHSFYTHR